MAKIYRTIHSWDARQFRHYHKTPFWYITLIIVFAVMAAFMILQKDWFGGVTITIIGFFFGLFARQQPEIHTVKISDAGMHLGQTTIPYSSIKHFWIVDTDIHKTLNLETTSYINHIHSIELEDEDAEMIREILLEVLPEHSEGKPTMAQEISHFLGF